MPQAARRRRPRRRSTSPDSRAARAEAAAERIATPVRGRAAGADAGAGVTVRAVSAAATGLATTGRIDGGGGDPVPRLAAGLKASPAVMPSPLFTPVCPARAPGM